MQVLKDENGRVIIDETGIYCIECEELITSNHLSHEARMRKIKKHYLENHPSECNPKWRKELNFPLVLGFSIFIMMNYFCWFSSIIIALA